jgi:tRNA-dihydrouridine synthase
VAAQLYGHTPEMFYKVAHIVCALGFDGLDINMGCPAKKVTAKGSGAALIRQPELARAIIRAARRGIEDWREGQTLRDLKMHPELIENIRISNGLRSGQDSPPERRAIPVSVKTRIGYDQAVVEDWVRTLSAEQPAVISLHGRTLKQGYKGNADWDAIARAATVCRNSETLILGNGDLRDLGDVYRRVRETGVDGVLLGRAAQGNPWIFRSKDRVKRALSYHTDATSRPGSISLEERFRVIIEHSRHFETHWGQQRFVGMRKHLAWYCRGFTQAAELRSQMVRVNSSGEVAERLTNYLRSAISAPEATAFALPERIGSPRAADVRA